MSKTPKSPKIRVKLTEELIEAGIRRHSGHCMFAEAIKVAFPNAQRISVDTQTVRLTDPQKQLRLTYLTPRAWQVQLVAFDQGRKPVPFQCLLRGAHITRSGNTRPPRQMTDKERKQRKLAGLKLNEAMKRTRLVERQKGSGLVPDRVGGQTPPMQMTDGVPFSRRRAFGLRGLEY